MTRLLLSALVLFCFTLPVAAATYTYEEGTSKSFSVNGGKPIPGYSLEWYSDLGLNQGPPACRTSALPTELPEYFDLIARTAAVLEGTS